MPDIDKILKNIQDNIIDNVIMKRLANRGIAIIRERTIKGEFLDGSSSNAGQYSTTPLPLPFGKFTKMTQKKILKGDVLSGDYRIFTNLKSGNTWIIIKGGYKKFRELAGKDTANVSLSWSGRMLRNLGVLNVDKTTAVLGFSSEEEKQKAIWHNVMGAGKSKKKHVFMDFSKDEREELSKMASEDIAKRLVRILK